MKETTCPLCGEKISIADETVFRQHVLCPYCNGKFSYLTDSAEFSSERLAYAISVCQKNAADSRYYSQAPAGARMYIGLLFYGRVFTGDLDANLYLSAIRKVEPKLSKRDWQYLLESESDSELAAYYKDRMDMAHVGPSSAMTLRVADYFKANTNTVQAVAVPRETIPATCPPCVGKQPTAKAAKNDRDGKREKRKRIRRATAKIFVAGAFMLSLLCSVAAYLRYQRWHDERRRALDAARRELAHYLSDTSNVLNDYHSEYSISSQRWRHVRLDDDAYAEKVLTWLDDAERIKSDIRRLLYDFKKQAKGINSISLDDLKFARSDFEFRVEALARRVRQLGFDPPVIVPTKGRIPAAPNSNGGVAPAPVQPKAKPNHPFQTERERMQLKVNKLMEELKRLNYGFDSEALKKEDLQTQLTMLEEMLYDVKMAREKGLSGRDE